MYKDLVLAMTGSAGDGNALEAAVTLADNAGAHLAVLVPLNLPIPMAGQWGLLPDVAVSEIYKDLREQAQEDAGRLRTRLGRERISFEVRIVESLSPDSPWATALHARHADVSLVAGAGGQGEWAAPIAAYFGKLLMESGRPVLVVPPRYPMQVPPRHAVVAWQPSREATRALHDAMPLLHMASSVDVVVVDPVVGERKFGELPGADIAVHLARHGLEVNVQTVLRGNGETVATALLRHAADTDAQLLVAGGYGHSRMREWALGGTTRELLEAMHLPVLFSH